MSGKKEWISFRLKSNEYQKIETLREQTTCRSMSEYARMVLLQNPVQIRYRNQSADQFLEEMILLKNELSAIGNNFNQAVKRLHTLDTLEQGRSWLLIYENSHRSFLKKVEEIRNYLIEIHQLWSQK